MLCHVILLTGCGFVLPSETVTMPNFISAHETPTGGRNPASAAIMMINTVLSLLSEFLFLHGYYRDIVKVLVCLMMMIIVYVLGFLHVVVTWYVY